MLGRASATGPGLLRSPPTQLVPQPPQTPVLRVASLHWPLAWHTATPRLRSQGSPPRLFSTQHLYPASSQRHCVPASQLRCTAAPGAPLAAEPSPSSPARLLAAWLGQLGSSLHTLARAHR
jgi:hypothetical protein